LLALYGKFSGAHLKQHGDTRYLPDEPSHPLPRSRPHLLIFLNAVRRRLGYWASMQEEPNEVARLDRRIADLRNRIKEAQRRNSHVWSGSMRLEILDLLSRTLKDLEARKAALLRSNP